MKYAKLQFVEEHRKVNYYSIIVEDNDYTEFEDFLIQFEDNEEFISEFEQMIICLDMIGERGAYQRFFRFEEKAEAIPSVALLQIVKQDVKNSLRLFCIRVNTKIVVLLNGGIKTSQKVQDSPNLIAKFRLANTLSKIITEKIIVGELLINDKKLKGDFDIYY